MNEQCKKHKYEHIQNIEINTTIFSESLKEIISIKIAYRGEYQCSVCGKKHIGKRK